MSTAWLIARRELSAYFSTYSGYVIVAGYLFTAGLLFNAFALGGAAKPSQQVLADFFYYTSGMAMVLAVLLAVRQVAEERQQGTLVLLRTAPVSERAVIWGKFLSAWLVFAVAQLASLYLPALVLVHGRVTAGHIVAGYLGLLLLGAAVIAVTLLASVWGRGQLMAGAYAALLVTVLVVVWMLARLTGPPLADVLSYAALHNLHFRTFSHGVLYVRDVFYYLGVTVLFGEAAVRALASWRWRQ